MHTKMVFSTLGVPYLEAIRIQNFVDMEAKQWLLERGGKQALSELTLSARDGEWIFWDVSERYFRVVANDNFSDYVNLKEQIKPNWWQIFINKKFSIPNWLLALICAYAAFHFIRSTVELFN